MADMSLFITIAVVVATLNISKARDESGREITPVHIMSDGIIRFDDSLFSSSSYSEDCSIIISCSHPEHFKCKIEPRSARTKRLVSSAVEEERSTTNDAVYLDERVRKEYASV